MLRFLLDNHTYKAPFLYAYVVNLVHTETGEELTPAPGREHLKVFGGTLSIDEFRGSTGFFRRLVPPFASTLSITEIFDVNSEQGMVPETVAASVPVNDEQPVYSQLDEWDLSNLQQPEEEPENLLEVTGSPVDSVYDRFLKSLPNQEKPIKKRKQSTAATGGLAQFLV
jgi:hypothetical protein